MPVRFGIILVESSALKHLEGMRAEDVVSLVVWLSSDDAANVNGHTFLMSTGRIALYSELIEEKTLVWVKHR